MNLKFMSVIAVNSILFGCAAAPPHTSPTSDHVAYIADVPVTESEYSFFGGFSGRSFSVGELNSENCINPSGFHTVTAESFNNDGLVVVKAEEEIALAAGVQFGNHTCAIQVATALEKDGLYQLSFAAGNSICGIGLAKIEASGELSPIETEKLEVGFTKFCKFER